MRDVEVSPYTHLTREDWERQVDQMLAAVRPHFTPSHAKMILPGPTSSYGLDSDGLEGYARTLLLAGFRLAGLQGRDPMGLADWYREGLIAGTDPDASGEEAWPRPQECAQAKVEAASIALVLDMTRPLIWDTLSDVQKIHVIDWFAPIVGDQTFPRNNWVWFRIVVETFLRSVGGPWSQDDIRADLAFHESCYHGGGWYTDGHQRAYDYYVGWAMHLYPILWSRMRGAEDFARPLSTDVDRLSRYLQDYVHLIGADGAPVFEGRSLIYRFAAAAPLWVGALAGVDAPVGGQLRRAASGILSHFTAHGAPNAAGLLDLGWHHAWPRLKQSYSGSSSPYWAAKGTLGLALPPDAPVWTEPEQPLPVEVGDFVRAVRPAGWLLSGTRADGIVRLVNHGTDHARPGDQVGDSPVYARLGYSTVTAPLMDADAERNPLDQSITLIDVDGRASHRAGMDLLSTDVRDGVGIAASISAVHWIRPAEHQVNHGSGIEGEVEPAGRLAVVSLVRGAWEVRLFRVEEPSSAACVVRVGGWPLTGPHAAAVTSDEDGSAAVRSDRLVSALVPLSGAPQARDADRREDATPLEGHTQTPTLTYPLRSGEWQAVGVLLDGTGRAHVAPPLTRLRHQEGGWDVEVRWDDGATTRCSLDAGEASGY